MTDNTEENFNTIQKNMNQFNEHQKDYTDLLHQYTLNSKLSSITKFIFKVIFFLGVILLMIVFICMFISAIHSSIPIISSVNDKKDVQIEIIVESITAIIASLGTVIVSIIKLPEIIAKYLFNPKEEEDLVAVIQAMQSYDMNMLLVDNPVEKALMEQKQKLNQQKITEDDENKDKDRDINHDDDNKII